MNCPMDFRWTSERTDVQNTTLDHFTVSKKDRRSVFIFSEKIGDRNGSSNSKQGVIKFIKREHVTIPIWELDLLCGLLNPFSLAVDYIKLRINMGPFYNCFFYNLMHELRGRKRLTDLRSKQLPKT